MFKRYLNDIKNQVPTCHELNSGDPEYFYGNRLKANTEERI